MNTKKIRVLLADDTLIAREGWKSILKTVDDIEVIGESTTAHETPKMVRNLQPDVLLMDLMWFDDETAGASAIAKIKQASPQTKIIAITAYRNLISGARSAGAEAALPKGFAKADLINTIRAVCQFEDFAPPAAQEQHNPDELSSREEEILTLIAQGLTDKAIANELSIAEGTAKNHVSSVLSKLGASNRAEAVSIGYQKHILKKP